METLNEKQCTVLAAAIDRIIPADDEEAGGVAAGIDTFIVRQLGSDGCFPDALEAYRTGLDTIADLAQKMYGAPFVDIAPGAQDAVLIALEAADPKFFRLFVEQAQEGFYTSPAAYEMIGWQTTG